MRNPRERWTQCKSIVAMNYAHPIGVGQYSNKYFKVKLPWTMRVPLELGNTPTSTLGNPQTCTSFHLSVISWKADRDKFKKKEDLQSLKYYSYFPILSTLFYIYLPNQPCRRKMFSWVRKHKEKVRTIPKISQSEMRTHFSTCP